MSSINPEGQICRRCRRHRSELLPGALSSGCWLRDPGAPWLLRRWGALQAGSPPPPPLQPAPARCCLFWGCCCFCCCCCSCGRLIPSAQLAAWEEQPPPPPAERAAVAATMPAIKRERPDREELALAAFNQPMETLPDYLVPLAAAAIPVVTPHPPAYEQIFATAAHHQHHHHHHQQQRAYLDFHAAPHAAAHSHPHPLPEDLMLERFSSIPDFQPFFDNGEPCIEVECGENKALLYINKLCQGSKGPSIRYRGEWLTPNEFQFVSGRETAKDWKRSIRHKGKSLKTLMSKGILQNRGRLAEKRTIPLPPTRTPKKELPSIFSHSDDSEESDKVNGHHPDVKQEEDLHISIMKRRIHAHWDLNISFRETSCSRDNELTSFISNLHQSRQLVMPETQSRCEFKRSSLDVGLGAADEVLGKRRACSPNSSSECPLESKKSRSESPKENSHTPLLEGAVTQMTPEEHYRRMMSALNEHGTFEEQQQQQQRLYQLANSMAVPSHSDLLRARQEVAAAAAVRNPSTMEAHLPSASNSSSQRRKQGLPQHRDSHFTEREMSHPPPLLSPQNAPHIALGPHLRPPFLGVPSALCQTPGYGFLQPAQAEMFARQQEMLRKQNLARLEMSAEIIRQKELENLHRQRLLASDPMSLHPGLPPDHPALRNVHDIPEGHPLRDELSRRNAMLVLRHNNTPLLSLNHGVPSASTTPPKEQGSRRGSRKSTHHRAEAPGQSESKELSESRPPDGNDEEMKDSESDADVSEEKLDSTKAESSSLAGELKECKEAAKACDGAKELGDLSASQSAPCSSSSAESPSHLLGPVINKTEAKYLPPASLPPPQPLPFGFPYTMSPYFHTGSMGGLFLDGEDSPALEDVSKWTVEDVCSFVGGLSGCAEYTQVFREQAIDGETLPLLTEEHLLNNMGLKLGPALKIRSQVAKRVGRVLYMASFPMAFPLQPPGLRPADRDLPPADLRPSSTGSVTSSPYGNALLPASRISPKQENGNPLLAGLSDTSKPPS
ncbi:sterile alpha motif domain-containing protein 11 isoform X3 [Podarcis raffonei]|uniref:sterile alpha motif domain-containing protein 11 isoform X3 n=2 Tax=Podarcis raffonei TaxID=65483 RepID=UPI002329453E|nr:sterile alpha motif domain-containing protein 11 isoform X3 [Podarcis raffonei]